MRAGEDQNSALAGRHEPTRRGRAPKRLARGVALLSLLAATAAAGATEPELQAFRSDGCSMFPDRDRLRGVDWCHCCVAHDLVYWRGGSEAERLAADRALEHCVAAATGDQKLAATMFAGVRLGGGPWSVAPYRWGYGWSFGRGYTPLSADERARAETLAADAPRQLAANCPRGDVAR